jgi:hypothetical protein
VYARERGTVAELLVSSQSCAAEQSFFIPPSGPSQPASPQVFTFYDIANTQEFWLWMKGPVWNYLYNQDDHGY